MSGYWERITEGQRFSRRRALALGGGGLGAAALIAACGGSSSSSGSSSASSARASSSSSASSGASSAAGTPQKGGRFASDYTTTPNYNPVSNWHEGTWLAGSTVYDHVLTAREDKRRYVLEAAQSIETPDPLTVVIKLKPGMTYHDFAPVNGRAVKGDDIVATQGYITNRANAFDRTFQRDFLDNASSP